MFSHTIMKNIEALAIELDHTVVSIDLAHCDGADLSGLPTLDSRRVKMRPPYWVNTDGKPTVYVFYNIGGTGNQVSDKVVDIATTRTIARVPLNSADTVIIL